MPILPIRALTGGMGADSVAWDGTSGGRTATGFPTALLSAAEMAVIEMVRFDAGHSHLKELLTLAEAACSCALDGIHASARDIATSTLGNVAGDPAADRIQATARAITKTDRGQSILTAQGFVELNMAITGTDVTGGHPSLESLVAFLASADIPVMVQAADAYTRFTAAAPFRSANARTGRVIMLALLRSAGVTAESIIPISAGMVCSPRRARGQEAHRSDGATAALELCVEAVFRALDSSLLLARDVAVAGERHRVLTTGNRSPAVSRIIPDLHRTPALNAEMVMAVSGVSESAAYRALDQLASIGILESVNKVNGRLTWVAPLIVSALDRFLGRAAKEGQGR